MIRGMWLRSYLAGEEPFEGEGAKAFTRREGGSTFQAEGMLSVKAEGCERAWRFRVGGPRPCGLETGTGRGLQAKSLRCIVRGISKTLSTGAMTSATEIGLSLCASC